MNVDLSLRALLEYLRVIIRFHLREVQNEDSDLSSVQI